MSEVNSVHEEKLTLSVDVNLPGHDERVTTPLFTRTRSLALAACEDRSFACNRTGAEAGPIELHHMWIERCLANAVDWADFRTFIRSLKVYVDRAAQYADDHPTLDNIMDFVDDMTANGLPLCKEHHTGKDSGIHDLPFPLWLLWSTGKEGWQFNSTEKVDHEAAA